MRGPLAYIVAGVHVVDAVGVAGRLRLHAANHGELVGDLGHFGKVLADLEAVHLGGDGAEGTAGGAPGLHVEGVQLAGSAIHPEQDAALLLLLGLGG